MKKMFLLILTYFTLHATAQVPEPAMLSMKVIGGNVYDEMRTNVTKTHDGGFVISLYSNSDSGSGTIDSFCSVNGTKCIFIKYNADASVQEWSKSYVVNGDTTLAYMFPQDDGSAVLGGWYSNNSGRGSYICKQDVAGNIDWSHVYSKDMGQILRDMIATDDGGYIMASESYYVDTDATKHYGGWMKADIFVLKLDSVGNKIWGKVIGGTNDDDVFAIVSAPNGGCYVAGQTFSDDYDCTGNHSSSPDVPDAYVARLDGQGNILWHRDLGGTTGDGVASAVPDGKGGLLIAAATNSSDGDVTHHISGTTSNIWLVDIDHSGNIVWDNCYGGGGVQALWHMPCNGQEYMDSRGDEQDIW